MLINSWHIRQAARAMQAGGVIAYPTEAVFGLGCDPLNGQAVHRLLALKQRPWQKGLILIAAEFSQLESYVQPLSDEERQRVMATWPGPFTWLLPVRPDVPNWIYGKYDTVAVRVTAHPLVAALCRRFGGPIISTSANPGGKRPARTPLAVQCYFDGNLDYVLHGALGGQTQPSEIRDLRSGRVMRPGG